MRTLGQLASMVLITIASTLLLTQLVAAQRTPEQSPPTLIVTPSTSIAFSGPHGGPFSPSLIEYRVSASAGTVSYSIRTPAWLTASSISGVTHLEGEPRRREFCGRYIWACYRVHERVKWPGQRELSCNPDCPSAAGATSSGRRDRPWTRRISAR
jgi:hypothetical protein